MIDIRQQGASRPFTGRHMLVLIIGFFGVVIAVNLVMAAFAISTWSGLVVKNGYVASQNFNKELAAARAQARLGWNSALKVENATLVFSVRDNNAQGVAGLVIDARLERLSNARSDVALDFVQASAGRYVSAAPGARGRWKVDITSHDPAGRTYRRIFEFTID